MNIATVGEWRLEFSGLWKVRCDFWQGKAIVSLITWLSWYLLADLEVKRTLLAIPLVENQKEEMISRYANANGRCRPTLAGPMRSAKLGTCDDAPKRRRRGVLQCRATFTHRSSMAWLLPWASNNIDRIESQPRGRTLSRKHYGVCLGSRPLGLCPGEASTHCHASPSARQPTARYRYRLSLTLHAA